MILRQVNPDEHIQTLKTKNLELFWTISSRSNRFWLAKKSNSLNTSNTYASIQTFYKRGKKHQVLQKWHLSHNKLTKSTAWNINRSLNKRKPGHKLSRHRWEIVIRSMDNYLKESITKIITIKSATNFLPTLSKIIQDPITNSVNDTVLNLSLTKKHQTY